LIRKAYRPFGGAALAPAESPFNIARFGFRF
jgi:hypothetical protein